MSLSVVQKWRILSIRWRFVFIVVFFVVVGVVVGGGGGGGVGGGGGGGGGVGGGGGGGRVVFLVLSCNPSLSLSFSSLFFPLLLLSLLFSGVV